jgi:hypothetical protein
LLTQWQQSINAAIGPGFVSAMMHPDIATSLWEFWRQRRKCISIYWHFIMLLELAKHNKKPAMPGDMRVLRLHTAKKY